METLFAICLAFDDLMRLNEHFHWLIKQAVASQVEGQTLQHALLENFVANLRKPIRKGQWILLSAKASAICFTLLLAVVKCEPNNFSRYGASREVARKNAKCNRDL